MNSVNNNNKTNLNDIMSKNNAVDNKEIKSVEQETDKEEKEIRVKETNKADNKENLKPWLFKKGQSGNPAGRKKGVPVSITGEIKKQLSEIPKGEQQNKLSKIVKVIFDKALKEKDDKMLGRIWAYIDGSPRQSTEIKLDTELTINITDTYKPIMIEPREQVKVIEDNDTGS